VEAWQPDINKLGIRLLDDFCYYLLVCYLDQAARKLNPHTTNLYVTSAGGPLAHARLASLFQDALSALAFLLAFYTINYAYNKVEQVASDAISHHQQTPVQLTEQTHLVGNSREAE
jgi:hypothetical protein